MDNSPAVGTVVTSIAGDDIMREDQSLGFTHDGLIYWGGRATCCYLYKIASMYIDMYILTGSCMLLPLLID